MNDLTIRFTSDMEDGTEREYELPARYEVCPRCDGHGKHVNPSVDGHGITASEWDELGPDFHEDYLNGMYDVTCYKCHGKRVVLVPDEDHADPDVLKRYYWVRSERAEYDAMVASEIAFGC